jgi:hypothetical protein
MAGGSIVLMLKTLASGNENVTFALGLGNQLSVRKRAPFGFRDGQNLMIGESLPQAGIDALVYEDTHSMSSALASSRN